MSYILPSTCGNDYRGRSYHNTKRMRVTAENVTGKEGSSSIGTPDRSLSDEVLKRNVPGNQSVTNAAQILENVSARDSAQRDNAMDYAMNDGSNATPLPARPKPPSAAPLLTYFRNILAKDASGTGTVHLDATTVSLMLQMMEQQQLLLDNFQKLADRVESLKLKQITRVTPPTGPSYASATSRKAGPPPPPTKAQMIFARPGQTTIHTKPGTNPLKEVNQNEVVDKANEVLGKLNATVQGEKVVIKAVRIQPSEKLIVFINLYNPPGTTTGTSQLRHWLEKHNTRGKAMIASMDSNLHHHSWNPPGYTHCHKDAKGLVALCGKNGFRLVSEKGTPTFLSSRGAKTTINLVWANFLASKLVRQVVTTSDNHGSDHQKLAISLVFTPPPPSFKVQPPPSEALDKQRLRNTVHQGLHWLSPPSTSTEIDTFEQTLTSSIFEAWQAQGKRVRDQPNKAKKWWKREVLDPLVKTRNCCRRLMLLSPSQENTDRYNHWNGVFRAKVNELKQDHWRNFLGQTDSISVFQAFKFTRPRSGNGILPLKTPDGSITSDKQKQAELLFAGTSVVHSFCDVADIPPPESLSFVVYPEVTQQETSRVLKRLAKKKASGPNRIPNEVLTMLEPVLTTNLTALLNSCIKLEYFPSAWRTATTIIIRKFGKSDYTVPGAYRPIALLNTLGKVFEAIIADRLTFWAETKGIIPEGHMGGRRGKCGEDAMLAMTMWIRRKWREDKVVTALFLDVKSAYPSVHPRRLIHSLRQKGCPTYLWKIIAAFLRERSTRLCLADYLSESFNISLGLPQGSPLSVILYILYNSDLLIKDFNFDQDQVSLGFIDDVVHLTAHKAQDQAVDALTDLGRHSLAWGARHGAIFDSAKAQFVIFTHKKNAKSPFLFDGQLLQPLKVVKWLGLWFDEKLTFQRQRVQAKKKADITMSQFQRIGNSRWGIREQERGLLISAVLTPRILYGIQLWYTTSNTKTVKGILEIIENTASRFALGALKSTPVSYLNKYRPFKSITQTAENRITNYFLSKLCRHVGNPTRIENQIRVELTSNATRFPSPVHASLAWEKLQPALNTSLEQLHLVIADRPPWRPGGEITTTIDNLPKDQAKEAITNFIQNQGPETLLVYTDGSATPEKGLGAAATTANGALYKMSRLGDTNMATNFECELVGIRLGLELGMEANKTRQLSKLVILSDSQAAIKRLATPGIAKPGQYLTL
ncbi:hypothetical protein MJO29_009583 [Puccinia striiformis f. sp. tritici]|nr:hypothetical protein MJO29_009583 [Puccinia striiformis f. sp. tritici]